MIITSSDRSPASPQHYESHNNGQEAAGALGSGPGDTAEKDDRGCPVSQAGVQMGQGWAVGVGPPLLTRPGPGGLAKSPATRASTPGFADL